MATFATGGGTTIAVSATLPATVDQAGYEALTSFVPLPALSELPERPASYESVPFNKLQDDSIDSVRGLAELINLELAVHDGQRDNAGYLAVKAAFDATKGTDAERIAVRIANAANTVTEYYIMRVFSMTEGARTGNDISSVGVRMEGPFDTRVVVES